LPVFCLRDVDAQDCDLRIALTFREPGLVHGTPQLVDLGAVLTDGGTSLQGEIPGVGGVAEGNGDVLILLDFVDFLGAYAGEKPELAVEGLVLHRHGAGADGSIAGKSGHHGNVNAFEQIRDFLQTFFAAEFSIVLIVLRYS
jgi:hypothetical protein